MNLDYIALFQLFEIGDAFTSDDNLTRMGGVEIINGFLNDRAIGFFIVVD